ncbi:hypothetical protein [Novosphingobium sp. JCM 18896]|uniref:hypothetical protein n=1 Tax=Novosphingobium sp. JCM 18896 TaxID=2989731 RepID=UPI002222B7C1|nr:hypothetical protein [Novosphingobium sp. JCM 18896]MCW1432498.1 hypothetical protein [Novosphingobium sp. JCM 18896]
MLSPPEIDAEDAPRPTLAQAEAAGQRAFDFMGRSPFVVRPASELLHQIAEPSIPEAPTEPPLPQAAQPAPPFGAWLLAQKGRKGWIGELSRAFQADRDFPARGNPDDVRRYLGEVRAEGDAYAALDDAELDWACL